MNSAVRTLFVVFGNLYVMYYLDWLDLSVDGDARMAFSLFCVVPVLFIASRKYFVELFLFYAVYVGSRLL